MDILGTCIDVEDVTEPLEHLSPLPIGNSIVVYPIEEVSGWTAPILKDRFPTPTAAIGFLGETTLDLQLAMGGLGLPYSIVGALHPEGSFLEPTIGQIWPR